MLYNYQSEFEHILLGENETEQRKFTTVINTLKMIQKTIKITEHYTNAACRIIKI